MAGIRRPRPRFRTVSGRRSDLRFNWWWAQKNRSALPGAPSWLDFQNWDDQNYWNDGGS